MKIGQISSETPSKVVKKPSKRKNKTTPEKELYFGPAVDAAIIKYNNEPSDGQRQVIFQSIIYPALEKLAENLIHVNKWYYTIDDTFEHVKQDVVTFLAERLYKYDVSKGKAFSYFDKIALNHLRNENKKGYKKVLQRKNITNVDTDSIDLLSQTNEEQRNTLIGFVDEFVTYMEVNIPSLYKKTSDQELAFALLSIFKNRADFEVFNKKIFYFVLRENTNATTTQVTRMVSSFKRLFTRMYSSFYKDGEIIMSKKY